MPEKPAAYSMADGQGHAATWNDGTRLVISEDDLESVASLFGRITALQRGGDTYPGSQGIDEGAPLDAHVRVVMRIMKERLGSLKDGPLQDAEIIMAKHGLYSICFQQLISVADSINPDLSRALENLRDAHHDLLQDVPGIVQRAVNEYQQEIASLRADKERDAREAGELVQAAQALERETIAQHEELGRSHLRLNALEEENASLKTKRHVDGYSSPLARPPHEGVTGGFTGDTTTSARKMPGFGLGGPSADLYEGRRDGEGQGRVSPEPSPRGHGLNWNQGRHGEAAGGMAGAATAATAVVVDGRRELSLKQLHDLIAAVYASKEKYDRNCTAQRLPSQTLARHLDDFLVHRYGLTSMAKIQATALRKGVERFRDDDIGVKVFEMTLRNEVDEGFRLKQRDLERAVLDFLRSRIRERVAHHDKTAKYDNRYSYRRLAGTSISRAAGENGGNSSHGQGGGAIRSAGACSLSASTATVESLLRSQTRSSTPLASADWKSIVRHVYKGSHTADAPTVGFLIKEAVSATRDGNRGPGNCEPGSRKGTTGMSVEQGQWSVPFGIFLQVLLGYQLHGYLRQIETFTEDFRELDIDADGVVNPAQFLTLAKRTLGRVQRETKITTDGSRSPIAPGNSCDRHHAMALTKGRPNGATQQAAARLRSVDPNGFGVITFSQCVRHLAFNGG